MEDLNKEELTKLYLKRINKAYKALKCLAFCLMGLLMAFIIFLGAAATSGLIKEDKATLLIVCIVFASIIACALAATVTTYLYARSYLKKLRELG